MNDVRDEAVAALLDRAATRIEPEAADRIDEILHRGDRRRTVRFTAIGTAIAVFVGAVAWVGLTFPKDRVAIPADITDWRTFASLEENGWTIQLPPSWKIQELPPCQHAPERIGMIATNVEFDYRNPRGEAPGCEDRLVFEGFPRDGVALAFMPVGARFGVGRGIDTCSSFPLEPGDLAPTGGIRGGPDESFDSIWVDGEHVAIVRRWVGPGASLDDVRALDRSLRSLTVEDASRRAQSSNGITTLVDGCRDYSVEYPDGWVVADENLTPWLSSPSEILSLGTFPLRVSNDPDDGFRLFDAPVAPKALADMTDTDAFISVQGGDEFVSGFGPRPDHFGPLGCEGSILGCDPANWEGVPFRAWWIPFQDEGRGLYLFVAIGDDATPELRDQAWAVADSLVFEPLEP